MKPKEILRTIESHLELKPTTMPRIKVDPEYLDGQGRGALVKMECEPLTMYLEKKDDLEVIAEELTHLADVRSGTSTRIVKDEDPVKYENRFYNNVLTEALGYYGSKLFIPKRKPISIKKKFKESIEKKAWKKLRTSYQEDLNVDRRTWHEIGYDLGEKVYKYVQKTGNKEPALSLLIKNRNEEKPFEVYKKILKEVTK